MADVVVEAGVTIVVVAGFYLAMTGIGRILRRRTSRGLDGRTYVLHYRDRIVGLAVIFFLFTAGMTVWFLSTDEAPQEDGPGWLEERSSQAWFLRGLWVASLALLYEVFRRRVVLDGDGITVRGWFGTKSVPWEEVVRITSSAVSGYFVVHGRTGKVRISHQTDGLDWFIEECRSRLKSDVYGMELHKPPDFPMM
jgi:hypothetical protein